MRYRTVNLGSAANGFLYRAEAKRYSTIIDAEAERYGVSAPELIVYGYPIEKRTPCGAWIDRRFVNLKARKKFACETIEDAIASFAGRKRAQLRILGNQIDRATEPHKRLERARRVTRTWPGRWLTMRNSVRRRKSRTPAKKWKALNR